MIRLSTSPHYSGQALRRARRGVTRLRRRLSRDHSLYLTIDDGPSDTFGQILEMLGRYNAKATFFLVGSRVNQTHRDLPIQAVRLGHALGNHTWSHRRVSSLTFEEIELEIEKGQEVIRSVYEEGGVDPASQPRYFRFPFGDPGHLPGYEGGTKGHRHKRRVAYQVLRSLDSHVIWWDINPGDSLITSGHRSVGDVAQLALRARGGDIVVIHDTPHTPQLLEHLLPSLTQRWSLEALTNVGDK